MSKSPPERYKSIEDFTVREHVAAKSARRRGEQFKPETDEYRTYRNEVLEAGGLEPDRAPGEKPLEELSAAEHVERMRVRTPRFGADN